MLQLALAGLLASSIAFGPTTGDDDKKKTSGDSPRTAENATPGVFETASADDPDAIIQDTYAFGMSSGASPIKFWASYAYGDAKEIWTQNGTSTDLSVATSEGSIVSQRANVGAQINFLSFPAFKLGAGANLTIAKNEFQVNAPSNSSFANGIGDIESDFGVQGLKVYGAARGRVVGVHGGYVFDFGSEREQGNQATVDFAAAAPGTPAAAFGTAPASINPNAPAAQRVLPTGLVTAAGLQGYTPIILPATLSNSDGRDAFNLGADFDYPSERFRLFGGVDYYHLFAGGQTAPDDDSNILNFMFGAGVRFSIVEVGAALQVQTRFEQPTVQDIGTLSGVGGHAGTVAPYLRLSPNNLPVSLFVKGAVQEEYTEFGYAIGGANSVKPNLGFTAGLTVGFE